MNDRAEILEDAARRRQERIDHPPVSLPKKHRARCQCKECLLTKEWSDS